jgi:amino acid adenylation domain-containing protein
MNNPSRAYWHDALLTGGFTAVPRWVQNPYAGVGEHEVAVDPPLIATLRRISSELNTSFDSILLAAHAKVLASLSGESEVATGYRWSGDGQVLLCRLDTNQKTWRDLILHVSQVELEVWSHRTFPVDELRKELGITEPLFETLFDASGNNPQANKHIVLAIGVAQQEDLVALRLFYRADAIDAEHAARLGGYHLTALKLIAADVDADHAPQSLMSRDEQLFQIDGMAGPRRDLPPMRVHQLFENRVRIDPDSVAVTYGSRQLSYWELNARANKVARALLARGISRESVVAVVTERNLHWIVAVLAIFKAGAAYLPIEPHFPVERIATTIGRAGCKLVLSEVESDKTLNQALDSLPGVQKLYVQAACEEGHADSDLNIQVAPDQLAYIYFTSGSTGEPKGAMCEHAGMLNHMLAKIDDLEIGRDAVVAQIAPQCFDISLWQLLSALLVGGRTLLIEQDVVLDVQRFVDTVIAGGVTTLQVVPSYLEVVLSYLEQHHHPLPRVRNISVTGEALTKELAQRFFATLSGIKLVNAYGLTETSDDTNHEIMARTPDRDRIALGAPINNVHVYVVDEDLALVPLGAPGEIVFSGICVGRGYVNDPIRTAAGFISDPYREGERLYRSGDYGRWQAEGKLEFLGRRDAQVKIRGFRVELGEIENRLMEIPGVSQCAVVVVGDSRSKQLVALYSGQRLDSDLIDSRLSKVLPSYMVPASCYWRSSLPLTANGKIDRKSLAALAAELGAAGSGLQAPITAAERRVATAWAEVLGISRSRIGRQDHFFDRGGTSLSAAKLVVNLGRLVSLKEVIRHPILADLAKLLEENSAESDALTASPRPDSTRSHARAKAAADRGPLHCAIVRPKDEVTH